ncbi:MAG: NlpC/P60 family protein [Verrucomicrobiales bacterium]|nr:NlpC/P60 family protein [Verrucomicrobiales bacterium]
MKLFSASFFLTFGLLGLASLSATPKPASVSSIRADDLVEFETLDESRQALIRNALSLTQKELRYLFGSNSPDKGGMDCSGAVQHAVLETGIEDVPRSSYTFYQWVEKEGDLVKTPGVTNVDDPVFASLQPGDLLFWQGTYETGKRNPPISHVMIYLGTLREDGEGVVFGASDGRRYRGKRINGVSVFDWKVPSATSKSKFVGYAPIPGLISDSELDEKAEADSGGAKERPKVIKSALEKIFGRREPDR